MSEPIVVNVVCRACVYTADVSHLPTPRGKDVLRNFRAHTLGDLLAALEGHFGQAIVVDTLVMEAVVQ